MGCAPSIIDKKNIIIPLQKKVLEEKKKINILNQQNNTLNKKNRDLTKEINKLQIIIAKNSIYSYDLEQNYKLKIIKKNKLLRKIKGNLEC